MSRKGKRKKSKPQRFCAPAVCDCCQYVGEGDFLCDEHMEIVVSNWVPTESYLICRTQHEVIGDSGND